MLEKEKSKIAELISELKKGEKSGFVKDFNPENFLADLQKKYFSKRLLDNK